MVRSGDIIYKMKSLLRLNQHEMGIESADDREITRERQASRAVVLNNKNEVALINFSKINTRKLPGGGIENDETPEEALVREIKEEIGYEVAEVLAELGVVEEERYFAGLNQKSYCYVVQVGDFVGTEPTKEETDRGIETIWYKSPDEAIEHIQQASGVDEHGNLVGRAMMNARDIAILEASKKVIKF